MNMKKKIQKYLSGEREGFSLIELIIVIAIMAILIGVIALVVLPYLESARENRDRQTLSEVSNAFKSAMADETVAKQVGTFGWTVPSGTLLTKMESYMDGTVADAKSKLSSDACKNASGDPLDFLVTATKDASGKWTLKARIGTASAAVTDSNGNAYEQ